MTVWALKVLIRADEIRPNLFKETIDKHISYVCPNVELSIKPGFYQIAPRQNLPAKELKTTTTTTTKTQVLKLEKCLQCKMILVICLFCYFSWASPKIILLRLRKSVKVQEKDSTGRDKNPRGKILQRFRGTSWSRVLLCSDSVKIGVYMSFGVMKVGSALWVKEEGEIEEVYFQLLNTPPSHTIWKLRANQF